MDHLEDLKQLLDASSNAEAVRRCLAQHALLLKAIEGASLVTIPGKNPKGPEVQVLMT